MLRFILAVAAAMAATACTGRVVSTGASATTAHAGGASSSPTTSGAGGAGATSSGSTGGGGGCSGDVAADPANCGRCGHSCRGGECLGGACQSVVLATGQDVASIALHPDRVYWSSTQGAVRRVARSGGGTVEDVNGSCHGLVAGGDVVYGVTTSNRLCRIPVLGGAPSIADDHVFTWQLAADASGVTYARARAGGFEIVAQSTVGPAKHVADLDVPPHDPFFEPGGVFLATAKDRLVAVYPGTNDDANEWHQSDGLVVSLPLPSGPVSAIASGLSRPWLAATDGLDAYWTVYGEAGVAPSTVWKAPLGGGAPELVYTAEGSIVDRLAVDDTDLWIAELRESMTLVRLRKDGAEPPKPVAGGLVNGAFAVDDSVVVWAATGPGGGDDDASIVLRAK